MATVPSDIRQTTLTREWSLGAVLAEREVDERTWLMAVRADAGLGASLALGRRLLGLRLAGYTTIVVDLGTPTASRMRSSRHSCSAAASSPRETADSSSPPGVHPCSGRSPTRASN